MGHDPAVSDTPHTDPTDDSGPTGPTGNATAPSESPVEATPAVEAPDPPPVVSFTLSEAAERCRVHRATIRRKLDDGAFPNAWREDPKLGKGVGPWRIPLGDLQAAGFTLSALGTGEPDRTVERDTDDQAERQALQAQLDATRIELQHEREMRQAHERTIDLLAQAIRALPPGVSQPPVLQQSQLAPTATGSARRRWWRR